MTKQSDGSCGAASLRQFCIIYFGNDWFGENRTSSHHVAERLASHARVLYVDSAGLRRPKASGRDVRKLFRKLLQAPMKPRRIGERMWHISVPQIPFRRLPLTEQLNERVGKFLIDRATAYLDFGRTISWFAVPHPGVLTGAFDEALIVYYCVDDYAALPDVDATIVARMDGHLTSRADLVFVSSAHLFEAKRVVRSSAVHHAPHGVDVDLFRSVVDQELQPALETRELKRPLIGFYGLIEAWVDLDLIAFLARQKPDWTFLLIGRVAVDVGELRSLSNVVFAGPQPYKRLPSWAKAFDVAIIPYRLTRQVENAAPLKLREYLATGKPVVAIGTPEIERFAEHVRIAQGPVEFLKAIEDALTSDSAADRARRIEATSGMTWERRVTDIVRIVEEKLQDKAANELA